MKKLLSVILTAAMAASMAVSVSAAPMECGNTWTEAADSNKGSFGSSTLKNETYAHSGSYAAYIYSDWQDGGYITYTAPISKKAGDGVYNFSFYTKSAAPAARVTIAR